MRRIPAIVCLSAFVLFVLATVGNALADKPQTLDQTIDEIARVMGDLERVMEPDASSVVRIELAQGHGSGFYIGDGYVVTAAHVVAGEASIKVRTESGEARSAKVVVFDDLDDLAILRVNPVGVALGTAALDCRPPVVGEEVYTRGNPTILDFVNTYGRVAGPPREVASWRTVWIADMTILPGNSGGPVFDSDHEVIGVAVGMLVVAGAPVSVAIVVPATTVCRLADLVNTIV